MKLPHCLSTDCWRLAGAALAGALTLAACVPAPERSDPTSPPVADAAADRAGPGAGSGSGGASGAGQGPNAGTGGTGGIGGQAGRPDAALAAADTRGDSARADGATAYPDARPPLEGGTPPAAGLDQRCTVPVTFRDRGMGAAGAGIFNRTIADPAAAMQAHARAICRILYRKVEEVKNVTQQGLTVEPNTTIAFAAGSNITFSTDYIARFAQGKNQPAIDAELNGVLVHEGTHVWQYNNGGGALVEAMADYVRFKAGFYTLARRRPGGNWNQPYTTGGFFIAWVEEKYDPDFGYKVNMGMKDRGFSFPAMVQQVTGKSVDAVWADYQAAIR